MTKKQQAASLKAFTKAKEAEAKAEQEKQAAIKAERRQAREARKAQQAPPVMTNPADVVAMTAIEAETVSKAAAFAAPQAQHDSAKLTLSLKWDENRLFDALLMTDEIGHKEHLAGHAKDSAEGTVRSAQYNAMKRMLAHATEHCTKWSKARNRISYNAMRDHKGTLSGNTIADSPLDRAQHRLRIHRTEAMLAWHKAQDKLTTEAGVPSRAFVTIAKEQGLIPHDFAVYTEAGNRTHPADKVAQWIAWHDNNVTEARSMDTAEKRKSAENALLVARDFIASGECHGMTEAKAAKEISKRIRAIVPMTIAQAAPIVSRAMLFPHAESTAPLTAHAAMTEYKVGQ